MASLELARSVDRGRGRARARGGTQTCPSRLGDKYTRTLLMSHSFSRLYRCATTCCRKR